MAFDPSLYLVSNCFDGFRAAWFEVATLHSTCLHLLGCLLIAKDIVDAPRHPPFTANNKLWAVNALVRSGFKCGVYCTAKPIPAQGLLPTPHNGGCALIATFAATIQDIGIVGFLFGYLFWGCLVGVLVTWFAHRTLDLKLYRFRKSAENTCESCRESMLDLFRGEHEKLRDRKSAERGDKVWLWWERRKSHS